MFNVSSLSRQSIKLLHKKLWKELTGPSVHCFCIYKSHKESQREITLIKLAPSPYFSTINICHVDMNVHARPDEIPLMTLQDIKETMSLHKQKPLRTTKGNNSHGIDP